MNSTHKIHDDLLQMTFDGQEEEKNDELDSQLVVKMQALSVGGRRKTEQQPSSDGSWSHLSSEQSSQDAQSASSGSWVQISEGSQAKSGPKPDSMSNYSIISEETNRTETDQIKKDLSASKLSKLNQLETKFKHQISNFDKTEICTICQYTFNECSSRLVHLKCGHYYHERCFVLGIATADEDEWKCLICRKDAITGEKVVNTQKKPPNPYGYSRFSQCAFVVCSKCQVAFKKGQEIDQHFKLTRHHNGRKYACRVCKSVYMTHMELMNHVFAVGHNNPKVI